MKSFNEVLKEYENWKISRPEGIDLTLEQWSRIMGPDYQSGFNDNAVKRVSAAVDRGLEYTGLPQAGAAVGRLAGKMTDTFVGNQEGRFERVGEAVGRGVPRGIAEVAPFFAGGSGLGLNIARALAAGSSGLNAYTQSDSPWQGVVGAATPLAVAKGAMAGERLVGRQLGKAAGLGTEEAIQAARVGTALAPKAALYGGSQAGAFGADVGMTVLGEGFEPLASAEYWFGQALGQTAFALPDAVRAAQAINIARKGQLGEPVAKPINPMFETQAKKKDLIEQLQTAEKGLESPEIKAFWESGGKQETLSAYAERLKAEAGQLETAFSLIDQTNLKLQEVPVDSLENLELVVQNYNGLVDEVKSLAPEYFAELRPITEESIAQNYKRFLAKGLDKDEAAERLGQLVKNTAQFMRRNPQQSILQLVDIFAAKEGYDEQGANALKQAAKNVMALSGLVEEDFDVVRILRDPEEKQVLMGYVKPIESKTFGLLTDLKEVFPKNSKEARSFTFLSTIAHEAFHLLETNPKTKQQIDLFVKDFENLSPEKRFESLNGLAKQISAVSETTLPLSRLLQEASLDAKESAASWFQLYATALSLEKVSLTDLATSQNVFTQNFSKLLRNYNKNFDELTNLQSLLSEGIKVGKIKTANSEYKNVYRFPQQLELAEIQKSFPGKVVEQVTTEKALLESAADVVLLKPFEPALVGRFGEDNLLLLKDNKQAKFEIPKFESLRQSVETLQKDFIRWEQNVETIEKLTAGYDPKTQIIEPFTVQQQDVLNDPKIQKLQFSLFQKNPDLEAMKGSTDISRATKLFGNYGEFIWEWSNKGYETVRKAGALTMAIPSFANQQLNYIMSDFLTVNMGGFSESIMNSKDSQLTPEQRRLKESVKLIQGKNKEALNAFNQLALMRNVEMEKRISKNLPLEMDLNSPEVKKVFDNFNLTLEEKNAVWRLIKSLEDVQKKLTKTTLDQKKIQNIALVANAILRTPKTNISKADVAFEVSKVLETVISRNIPPQAIEAAKRQFATTLPRQEGENEANYQQRLNREFHRQEIPKFTSAIENILLENQIIPDVQNFTGIIKTALTLHVGKADIANLLEKRLWYTTETRNGKFLITYEKDGITGAIGAANEKEVASYIKLLQEDTGVSNIKWDKMELFKPEKLPTAVQTQMLQRLLSLEESVYEEVLQDWTSSGLAAPGISPQDFLRDYLPGQAALAALQQQQKNKFLKSREFKPGREFVDIWDAQLRYWQGLSWSSTIGSIKSLHDMYLQDHSLRAEPQLKKVMDNHINAILDPDSREWVTMKKFAFVYWLALVPSTLPVELSQSFFTLMPEITRQTGDIKKSFSLTMEASKDLVEAVKRRGLKPGTYQFSNPLYTKLFDRATRQEGWLESFGAGEDALQESDFINSGRLRLGLTPETPAEHLTHWAGQSFNLMRKFYGLATNTNAKLMFLTGIKIAESKGMREETDIYNFARFFAQTTGKLGGKYNRLMAFDMVPKINGPLGFVTTMQNYTFATIAQLVRYGKESLSKDLPKSERRAAQKAFTQMLGTSLFFSGLVGLPFAAAGMRLLEELTGEDVYGLVEEALGSLGGEDEATGQVISDIAMNGLVSRLFGIDLTSRTGLGQVAGLNPYNGFDPWNLGGPTVGAGRSIVQGVEDIVKGDLTKGLESMAPRFLKGVLGQFRNPAEATTASGQLLTKLSFAEQLATISGFTPKRVADMKNTRQRLDFMDRSANEAKSREMNRLAEAFLEGKDLRETVRGMEQRDVLSLVDRIVDKKIPLDLTREVNRANQAEREAFLRRRGAEMQSEVFRLKLRKQVLSALTGVPAAPTMRELREATEKDRNRQAVFAR